MEKPGARANDASFFLLARSGEASKDFSLLRARGCMGIDIDIGERSYRACDEGKSSLRPLSGGGGGGGGRIFLLAAVKCCALLINILLWAFLGGTPRFSRGRGGLWAPLLLRG